MILGVLQARASSTRLPGKVLKPILGKGLLARQIERLQRSETIDRLVLATSTNRADDAVTAIAVGTKIYRGSLEDVLDRVFRAAAQFKPSHVVRLTGDCPLADWRVMDRVVRFAVDGGFDYASNTLKPTWPDGLDVEVVRFEALETAWNEASDPAEREHVTPFLYRRPDRFKLGNLENDTDLSHHRWTLDTPADFEFVRQVYDALYPLDPDFDTDDVLALLREKPELSSINSGDEQMTEPRDG